MNELCNNCGHDKSLHVQSARAYPSLPGMQWVCSPEYVSESVFRMCACGGFKPIELCVCGHKRSAHTGWSPNKHQDDFTCAVYPKCESSCEGFRKPPGLPDHSHMGTNERKNHDF